jgi:hypothetical protein
VIKWDKPEKAMPIHNSITLFFSKSGGFVQLLEKKQ